MNRFPASPALLFLVATSAGATGWMPPPDGALREQAAVVAEVGVLAVSPAPGSPIPSTDHIVLVERIFKGRLPGTTIILRLPGGRTDDGRGLRVDGAPALAEGDRLIAFLAPRDDGTYGVLHLALGLFHEIRGERRTWAARLGPTAAEDGPWMRDLERWTTWLADPEGRSAAAALRRPPAALRQRVAALREARALAASPATAPPGEHRWVVDRRLPAAVLEAWERAAALAGGVQWSTGSVPAGGLAPPGFWLTTDEAGAVSGRFDCAAGGLGVISATRYRPSAASGRGGASVQRLGTTVLLQRGAECLAREGERELERLLLDEIVASGAPSPGPPARDR